MFSGSTVLGGSADRDSEVLLLREAACRLSAAVPVRSAADEVVKFVTAVINCDSCMVYLSEKDELVLRASKNPRPEVVDRLKMTIGEGITGWVAKNRKPVAISKRAYEDPRFKFFHDVPEDSYEAFLSVPIASGGRLVGVINVQNNRPYEFSSHEITLVATFGALVGAEIERARLESENAALQDQVKTRELIEQAKAILRRDLGITEEAAYRTLQRESQQRRQAMRQIAEAVILIDSVRRNAR